jgi:hypothetical protein
LKELQSIWLDLELLNQEELEDKENVIKDRYNKIIEIENKIQWNVSFSGSIEEEDVREREVEDDTYEE